MVSAYDFLGELGLGGIFLGTVIEALGVPFPGGIMLVLAGVLVSAGRLNYVGALVLAVAGFNIGATAAYIIGKKMGEPFFSKFEKVFKIDHARLEKARSWMKRTSAGFIILGRFVPMASNLTPYMAGMSRLGLARFLLYNSIFALVWTNFNLLVGYYFSKSWKSVIKLTGDYLPYIAGLTLLAYLGIAMLVKKKI